MKTIEGRLNNVIGQLNGAKKMLASSDRDCFALIIQLKAARSAVSSLIEKVVIEELDRCFLSSKKYSKERVEKIFKEVINSK